MANKELKDEYGETGLESEDEYGNPQQSGDGNEGEPMIVPDNAGLIGRKLKPGSMPPVEDKAPIKTVETA